MPIRTRCPPHARSGAALNGPMSADKYVDHQPSGGGIDTPLDFPVRRLAPRGRFPHSATANTANHAVSGLTTGFAAGFIGLVVHQCKAVAAVRPTAADQ